MQLLEAKCESQDAQPDPPEVSPTSSSTPPLHWVVVHTLKAWETYTSVWLAASGNRLAADAVDAERVRRPRRSRASSSPMSPPWVSGFRVPRALATSQTPDISSRERLFVRLDSDM